jgi:glycosyltransferase involved in cell wall biosynthesis
MARVRLLCLLPDLNGGGAERMMIYLTRGLDRGRYDITLALGLRRGPYLPLVPADIRLVELGHSRGATSITSVARLMREGRYDLCFSMVSMNLTAVLARALARSDVRLVLGARNHYSRSMPAEAASSRLKMGAIRLLYPRSDLVIGVSKGVTDDLVQHFGLSPAKVRPIHNPIDIDRVRSQAAQPLGDPWLSPAAEIPVLVAVGKLQPAKGYPDLIDAFRIVRSARPARLVILGQGPDQAALEARIRSYGLEADVRFAGFDANPYRWLARSTAFVHAAHWEGFPNVLVEAMACGVPVVSTDCPSGPAEIITNGRDGFLVPVGDPASHAARTLELLGDDALRARVVAAASERVQDFAVDRVLRRYAETFEEVIGRRTTAT